MENQIYKVEIVSFGEQALRELASVMRGMYAPPEPEDSLQRRNCPGGPVIMEYKEDMSDDIFPDYQIDEPRAMSDEDVEAAMMAARERGVKPQAIMKMLRTVFGIKDIMECPHHRRYDLINELYKLTA